MTIRWQLESDSSWSAWAVGQAWNGEDLEVGSVTHSLRPAGEPSGYLARYWGREESARWAHQYGEDRLQVGGLRESVELAMAALEERHAEA